MKHVLLHSKFETYLFDEETEEKVESLPTQSEFTQREYPQGFFSEL